MKPSPLIQRLLTLAFLLAIFPVAPVAAAQSVACTSPITDSSSVEPIHMVFGGDIVLGNSYVVEHIPKDWEQRYFAGVRDILKKSDMAFGNFEDTLTDFEKSSKNTASGTKYAFRSPPHYAELLYQEGFRVLNVANNHANDFGETGFRDTVANMRSAGIAVAGLKDQTATLSIRGLNIAVLGFAYLNRFNMVQDIEEDAERVRQAKAQGAYVIVTFHGGAEGSSAIWNDNAEEEFLGENRGNTVAFSRAMIDAGADLVVGHGPHVLRAAECYQGKPIVYSLGNFVGVGGLSMKNYAAVSALLEVAVNPDGSLQNINLVPIRFNEQKLPQIDPQEYGTRLVNYLGEHARFAGTFIKFPVSSEAQEHFLAWFTGNSPPMLAKK
jgi:poly-gamma-glutamate capsule biosynthesis protein CapA/YwtB (metallophosphatase superfamily)